MGAPFFIGDVGGRKPTAQGERGLSGTAWGAPREQTPNECSFFAPHPISLAEWRQVIYMTSRKRKGPSWTPGELHGGFSREVWRLLTPGPGPLLMSGLSLCSKLRHRPHPALVTPSQTHAEGDRRRHRDRLSLPLWCGGRHSASFLSRGPVRLFHGLGSGSVAG